jgi:hypothetical protein
MRRRCRTIERGLVFDHHVHFLHDVGAFQIGLGVMLLLALT